MGGVHHRQRRQTGLQKYRTHSRRQLWKFRLLLILPFAATALLLAPLAILKKGAEVEITLHVDRVAFVIGERHAESFFGSTQTASLSVLNLRQLELGSGDLEMATAIDPVTETPSAWQWVGTGNRIQLHPKNDFASVRLADVTLAQLEVQSGSRMTLSGADNDSKLLSIRVDGAETVGRVVVDKVLQLSCNYCEVSGLSARHGFDSQFLRLTSERDHVVTFSARNGVMTIGFVLPPAAQVVESNISLDGKVDFTRLEGKTRTSSVINEGGKIIFENLQKSDVQIRAGDFVVLDDLHNFFIKRVQIDKGIHLILHGYVGKLSTGPSGFVKNRLPSWLEWLFARQAWALYLNALVLISTTALAILMRLKLIREEG